VRDNAKAQRLRITSHELAGRGYKEAARGRVSEGQRI